MDPIAELRGIVQQGFDSLHDKIDSSIAAVEVRLGQKIDGVEARLGQRIDGVEGRLAGVEGRLDGVESRLDGVEDRLGRIEQDLGFVKRAVLDHTQELKEIRVALDRKVDRDELEARLRH